MDFKNFAIKIPQETIFKRCFKGIFNDAILAF